jgi:hypothetical protein
VHDPSCRRTTSRFVMGQMLADVRLIQGSPIRVEPPIAEGQDESFNDTVLRGEAIM